MDEWLLFLKLLVNFSFYFQSDTDVTAVNETLKIFVSTCCTFYHVSFRIQSFLFKITMNCVVSLNLFSIKALKRWKHTKIKTQSNLAEIFI